MKTWFQPFAFKRAASYRDVEEHIASLSAAIHGSFAGSVHDGTPPGAAASPFYGGAGGQGGAGQLLNTRDPSA
jgi:hypothetical protein